MKSSCPAICAGPHCRFDTRAARNVRRADPEIATGGVGRFPRIIGSDRQDALIIVVWKNETLSRSRQTSSDGKIFAASLINDIQAAA